MFCNSLQLSCRIGFNFFSLIESAIFHCFLQFWKQEEVTRSKVRGVGRVLERRYIVFSHKLICGNSRVGTGILMVHDSIARLQLLRAMSVHSIAKVLQECFVEFLIYHLSSRDVLMMNQPVNVKERNQHGLDNRLQLPCFLWSRRRCRVPPGGHVLCFWDIPVNPALITSDYQGHEVGIVLGSLTEVSAN